jgi:uncharacterized protein (TIGR01319 family)
MPGTLPGWWATAWSRAGLRSGASPGKSAGDPEDEREISLVKYLRDAACDIAFKRHAGTIKHLYGPGGRITLASGKDLTGVKTIIGTGGPLTRLPGGREALAELAGQGYGRELYPKAAQVAIDRRYIMATCGVLARRYPEEAISLLLNSLELKL